jgi:hypothetical protein
MHSKQEAAAVDTLTEARSAVETKGEGLVAAAVQDPASAYKQGLEAVYSSGLEIAASERPSKPKGKKGKGKGKRRNSVDTDIDLLKTAGKAKHGKKGKRRSSVDTEGVSSVSSEKPKKKDKKKKTRKKDILDGVDE